nr:hypothetical protein [Tanacetum cinerariifolium]
MVGGPLPRWRNPPPCQIFNIPQMDVGVNQVTLAQRQSVGNPNKFLNSPLMMLKQSQPYAKMAYSSQMMVTGGVSGGEVLSFVDVKFGTILAPKVSLQGTSLKSKAPGTH